MYFAQNNTRNQFELYLSFLGEIVDHNNQNYKAFFQGILRDTRALSTGEINYSNLSAEHFDIISVLSEKHKDYFRDIDVDHLTTENFNQILTFLKTDVEQLAY